MDFPHDADLVGHKFVKKYYTQLNEDPSVLHRFYNPKNSSFSHGEEGSKAACLHGHQDINDAILALGLKEARAAISQVDCQSISATGLLIQVIGSIFQGDVPRKFCQSFVLQQTEQSVYLVTNDVFRYVQGLEQGSAALAPAAVANTASAPVVVTTPEPEVTTAAPSSAVAAPVAEQPAAAATPAVATAAAAQGNDEKAQRQQRPKPPRQTGVSTVYEGAKHRPAQPAATAAPAAAAATTTAAPRSANATGGQRFPPRFSVHISRLPSEMTEAHIRTVFQQTLGSPPKSVRLFDPKPEFTTRAGTVDLENADAVAKALSSSWTWEGTPFQVKENKPKPAKVVSEGAAPRQPYSRHAPSAPADKSP
eukprot:m.30704 g.30704  ORF g.30704 m.30704 type:complete len:365 (+) comp41322_c0_seq1:243-1337(+)